jgi:hypothetical protein
VHGTGRHDGSIVHLCVKFTYIANHDIAAASIIATFASVIPEICVVGCHSLCEKASIYQE